MDWREKRWDMREGRVRYSVGAQLVGELVVGAPVGAVGVCTVGEHVASSPISQSTEYTGSVSLSSYTYPTHQGAHFSLSGSVVRILSVRWGLYVFPPSDPSGSSRNVRPHMFVHSMYAFQICAQPKWALSIRPQLIAVGAGSIYR